MLGVLEACSLVKAADQLEVQLDGMLIPISIKELSDLGRSKKDFSSELNEWLDLLDSESRADLVRLLHAPLLKDRSMARQMLRSWAGRQLLDELSDLIRVDEDMSGATVFNTMEWLLESQPQLTTLDLLEALPVKRIQLDLDGLLQLATRWRFQLLQQQKLLSILSGWPTSSTKSISRERDDSKSIVEPEIITLRVAHRSNPLEIEFWQPLLIGEERRRNLIFLMPGLGSSQEHFSWLSERLAHLGWPVVVLEHPGSGARAVKELLEGRSAVPGAEVLPDRLLDLQAVLDAFDQGRFNFSNSKPVFIGHSLGALTALLASGSSPQLGLEKRCIKALDDLSLTNLSQLLQCQLADVNLPNLPRIQNLEAIVALNSFGSLLWPTKWETPNRFPVLFVGGTLDLITPPLSEQLGLFLSTPDHPLSRLVLVEGGSHFSAIGLENDINQDITDEDDLFQLGEELVGVQPQQVQRIIASEIIKFLEQIEQGVVQNSSKHMERNGLRLHRLNRSTVEKILQDQ